LKIIKKYFPNISEEQNRQFKLLAEKFAEYNLQVNMISRKDVENLEERHILHSLAIARLISFKAQTRILDIGTGGGFPGLPLAIMFPDCKFYLVDSIGKKIKIVSQLIDDLGLKNVEAINARAETLDDYKLTLWFQELWHPLSDLYKWGRKLIARDKYNDLTNGFVLLKGGNLTEEKNEFKIMMPKGVKIREIPLDTYFKEPFFETKKIIYVPI
jgi:16S rRNA (guanine527-N7)-methyltransferase